MPSATATMYLNVSAIQLLCRGPRGAQIQNGSGLPAIVVSAPLSGDYYFDTSTNFPATYDLYGPYTTVWPSTAFRVPSLTLISNVSATQNASLTALSADFNRLYTGTTSALVSTLSVINPDTASGFTTVLISHASTTPGVPAFRVKNAAALAVLTVSNSATVGINIENPSATLHVAGNMRSTSLLTVDSNLTVSGQCVLSPGVIVYSGVTGSTPYNCFTLNVAPNSANFIALTAYSAWLSPYRGNSLSATLIPPPIRIVETTMEVGSTGLVDRFFVVNPLSARIVTIQGTVSALSSVSTNYYDAALNQLLTTRQVTPNKLTAATASSASLVAEFNTLLDRLTAHGMIR